MDISLKEIKEILSYEDFERIIKALKEAEKKANLKINELKNAKARTKRARTFYESKLQVNESSTPFFKEYKERKILLSSLTSPTIDNLYNYHRHFFNELPENIKSSFSFKDLAGIYEENNQKQMFAECITYKDTPLLKTIPSGKYLCINAKENELEKAQNTLIKIVKEKFNHEVKFIVKLIILKGILNWDYEVQVLYE